MTNENFDVAEMQRREFDYKEIRSRINREHELISNRIGWLLTSNAFLVTPLVIYYNKTSDLFHHFPYIITIFALILASLGCYTIGAAVETINVLKKRETDFMKENPQFHRLDPDQDYKVSETSKESKDGYKRKENTHARSMIYTQFIPVLVLVFWIVILGGIFWHDVILPVQQQIRHLEKLEKRVTQAEKSTQDANTKVEQQLGDLANRVTQAEKSTQDANTKVEQQLGDLANRVTQAGQSAQDTNTKVEQLEKQGRTTGKAEAKTQAR